MYCPSCKKVYIVVPTQINVYKTKQLVLVFSFLMSKKRENQVPFFWGAVSFSTFELIENESFFEKPHTFTCGVIK
jgi:hypothetical protein